MDGSESWMGKKSEGEGAGIRQRWALKKCRWRCGRHGNVKRRKLVSLPVMKSSKEVL